MAQQEVLRLMKIENFIQLSIILALDEFRINLQKEKQAQIFCSFRFKVL